LVILGRSIRRAGKKFCEREKKAKIHIENLWEYDIIILKSSGSDSAVIKKG